MSADTQLFTPWTSEGDDGDWEMPTCDGVAVCGSTTIYDANGAVVAFAVNVGWNDKDVERRDAIIVAINSRASLLAENEKLREAMKGLCERYRDICEQDDPSFGLRDVDYLTALSALGEPQ